MKELTTAEKAKIIGFKNLREVCELESRDPNTLRLWDRNNPIMFDEFLTQAWKRKQAKIESDLKQ